ncbi:Ger(x)C family spore germination protein [Paenibacillus pasadenensis]|uniref:Ger(x)C family spore germination protein n=1 Tax=Paenibacillus pasadenensis TaxID=217090 RepID=UPI00203AD219|nr:Ger(x)C family spore germination protein [Paenibacillus pasadenensis]MCM3746083.1 Ger(x)C family spore germination protein [Paenibacillus pasadenensis]
MKRSYAKGTMSEWSLLRRSLAALLLLLLLGVAGCWDRQELNELGIISATGIDITDSGRWKLSYQLVIPNAISSQGAYVGSSASPVNVFTTEGDSFRGAVNKATQEMSRRLYFSHNQIVIVGEKAARKGIAPLIEAYMRNGDSRETVAIFVTEGTARKVLEQLLPLEKISGAGINRLIGLEEKYGGNFRAMTMFELGQSMLGPVHVGGVAGIGLRGNGDPVDSVDAAKATHTGTKVRLQKVAIFKENRMIGWMTSHESRGILWAKGWVKETSVSFACEGERLKRNSIRIRQKKGKITPIKQGSSWLMRVEVSGEGALMEYNCPGDMSKPGNLRPIAERIEQELKDDIEDSIRGAQSLHADIFGFGNLLLKQHTREWKKIHKNWNEQGFPKIESEVIVKVKINKTGRSVNSYNNTIKEMHDKE